MDKVTVAVPLSTTVCVRVSTTTTSGVVRIAGEVATGTPSTNTVVVTVRVALGRVLVTVVTVTLERT